MASGSVDVDQGLHFDQFANNNNNNNNKSGNKRGDVRKVTTGHDKAGIFSSSSSMGRQAKPGGQFYKVPLQGSLASLHEAQGDSYRDTVMNGSGSDPEKDTENMQYALDKYSQAIAGAPTGSKHIPVLAQKLAEACLWLGKHELGIKTLAGVIKQFPHNNALYLLRGTTHLEMGYYDNAIQDFSDAVDKEAGNVDKVNITAFERRAQAYYRQKNWRKALEDFDRVSSVHSAQTRPEMFYKRGMCHSHIKNYPLAIKDLKAVREALGDIAAVVQLTPDRLGGEPRQQRSIDDLHKKIIRRGKEPVPVNEDDVIVAMATAYKEMGQFEVALDTYRDYERRLEEKGTAGDSKPYIDIANCCQQMHDNKQAKLYFDKAVESDPNKIAPRRLRAAFHEQAENLEQAIEDHRAILKITIEQEKGSSSVGSSGGGGSNLPSKKSNKAQPSSKASEKANIHLSIASLLVKMKEYEKAIAEAGEAVQVNPKNEEVKKKKDEITEKCHAVQSQLAQVLLSRQDKTRHGTTRQDKTRQHTTRHDTTRQTRQDTTRHDTTRHDKTRQDKIRQDKTR